MTTNPTPYALGPEDGEALWFFGMLVTMKATAEQTPKRGYPIFFSVLSSHSLMPISCSISASWCSLQSRS